jgi:phage/plasmid primase-like uncharacterized protein
MITLEQLAHRCDKVRWNGKDSFLACCVAHDDRNPSMSVREAPDGMILAHCHAGCPQDAVIEALGFAEHRDDYIPPAPRKSRPAPDTSATEAKSKRAVELSTPAPDNHAYLIKKAIQPNGIGVLGGLYKDLPAPVRNKGNVLVIPMMDVNGKVLSCQFIAEDGSKAYIAGQKRKGGFYYIKGGDRLWICEGFATGASLQEDTGDSVACAFDTGGLLPVTAALTALYGTKRRVIIMADDDWQTDSNPGLNKATAAAQVNGIKVLQPDFTGLNRGPKDTDFNDMVGLRNG